jgi:hypothetical protein
MQQITDPMANIEEYADMINEQLEMQRIPSERGKHSVRKKYLRPRWLRNRTCPAGMSATFTKPWVTPSSGTGVRRASMARDVRICTSEAKSGEHYQS